ncbi:MAG: DUF2179 domain-containing protein [Anaerolineae bacterium]|nr:DUF2179 domain-containing protein [Anaerolineae bacterium]
MAEMVMAGLLIFVLRVTDMSLDTLRLLFVMRGRKLAAAAIGATQAGVFIVAVAGVLARPLNAFTVAGYALGFGVGIFLGMVVEERLAIGYMMFRVYSPEHGKQIAEALRAAGHASTEFLAQGRSGEMMVVTCAVMRKDANDVRKIILDVDRDAFITMDEVRPLQRGYFRKARVDA